MRRNPKQVARLFRGSWGLRYTLHSDSTDEGCVLRHYGAGTQIKRAGTQTQSNYRTFSVFQCVIVYEGSNNLNRMPWNSRFRVYL